MLELKRGFGFIEILLVMTIILFLCYKLMNLYFKNSPVDNTETRNALREQGINTSSYQTIVDTTKKKIEDIQTQHFNELNKIE